MAETTDQRDQLQARLREGAELLRPHPHRGDLIAAGAVPLTVALLLVNARLDASWGSGIFLVLDALAAGLVLGMGILAPREEERPRAYQVVLQLCGLVLLALALLRLGQVFGVGAPLGTAWTSFLILGIVAGTAAWLARERDSEICTLVAGIAGTFALLSFVDWVFSPDGPGTTRWILLLAALGLLGGALVLRDRHRRESVYLVDAAGVAILVLGLTFVFDLLFGAIALGGFGEVRGDVPGPGVIWKVVLLSAGLGLVAYAGVDREPGPGYLGTLILLVFVLLVGNPGEGGPSLWFWPLVLLLVGGAMIVAGLRPRRELPPEPARGDPAAVVPAPVPPPPAPPAAAAPAPEGASAPEPALAAPASEFVVERPAEPEPAAAPPAPEPEPPAPDPAAAPAEPPAPEPEPPAPEPEPEPPAPEPPASGSLWARADPGEQPTRPHRVPPPADDDPVR